MRRMDVLLVKMLYFPFQVANYIVEYIRLLLTYASSSVEKKSNNDNAFVSEAKTLLMKV